MKHYPHHISDFNNATRHLNRVERGLYRDLLDLYYETEKSLPFDVIAVCRLIVANELSTDVERMLNEFFVLTPQGWYHVRCEDEISKYQGNNSQRALAGKASAAKKALKKHQALNGVSTTVDISLNENSTEIQNQSTNQPINQSTNKKDNASVAPFGVCDVVWSDFLKIRRAKKSPMTNTALAGIQREADKAGVTLEDALKTCCERGWVGFKAEWLADKSDLAETVYQKSMRLRVAEIAPEIARAAPGAPNITDYFRTIEASTVKTLEISK